MSVTGQTATLMDRGDGRYPLRGRSKNSRLARIPRPNRIAVGTQQQAVGCIMCWPDWQAEPIRQNDLRTKHD